MQDSQLSPPFPLRHHISRPKTSQAAPTQSHLLPGQPPPNLLWSATPVIWGPAHTTSAPTPIGGRQHTWLRKPHPATWQGSPGHTTRGAERSSHRSDCVGTPKLGTRGVMCPCGGGVSHFRVGKRSGCGGSCGRGSTGIRERSSGRRSLFGGGGGGGVQRAQAHDRQRLLQVGNVEGLPADKLHVAVLPG
jgi:hypothetical protein